VLLPRAMSEASANRPIGESNPWHFQGRHWRDPSRLHALAQRLTAQIDTSASSPFVATLHAACSRLALTKSSMVVPRRPWPATGLLCYLQYSVAALSHDKGAGGGTWGRVRWRWDPRKRRDVMRRDDFVGMLCTWPNRPRARRGGRAHAGTHPMRPASEESSSSVAPDAAGAGPRATRRHRALTPASLPGLAPPAPGCSTAP
jgi:hypothetical protein